MIIYVSSRVAGPIFFFLWIRYLISLALTLPLVSCVVLARQEIDIPKRLSDFSNITQPVIHNRIRDRVKVKNVLVEWSFHILESMQNEDNCDPHFMAL